MSHTLSVRGNIKPLYDMLPQLDNIAMKADEDMLVFSSDTEKEMLSFKKKLAPIISEIITAHYEKRVINRIINTNYTDLTPEEKRNILTNTYCERKRDTDPMYVTDKLSEYLASSDELHLDGFVNFRLKDYINELTMCVDKSVDLFLTQREYSEFTALLKYFVKMQPTREKTVHIIAGENGGYMILNSEKQDITAKCIGEFLAVVPEDELNFDDLLLSTLISLAPVSIVFHNKNNIKSEEILNTIKEIFGNKIINCDGCDMCMHKTYES